MKIARFFLVLALLACAGCFKFTSVAGSGRVVTTNFNFTGFQSIEAGGAFKVNIQPGDQFAVSVSADDNLFDDLSIIQNGSWLRLGVKNGINISSTTLAATVTLPNLADVEANGASRIEFGSFKMDHFKATASGASRIKGEFHAKNADVDCSGASSVHFSGDTVELALNISGASSADCADLTTGRTAAEASGASKASVHATRSLDYNISGASHLTYSGDAQIGRDECSGASSVSKN